MSVFNFPYHTLSIEYPTNSAVVQFGGSYDFASRPAAPPQRTFKLVFPTMFWYITAGGAIDIVTNPTNNVGTLDSFYKEHELWKTFTYNSMEYGSFSVRFKTPLVIPAGVPGGTGAVNNLSIDLLEQP